ncbi:unnamed protein product [Ceratitis capitata]|uniref:(Mediterranean fruit fly) hypothetical protein n=1 Tax=Ceratitis capitata TaxID=7213 RepID=A0A811VC03_CERCA|nr:unnamed protein product [Ceratitis capitata]
MLRVVKQQLQITAAARSSCGNSEQRKAMSAFLSENFDLQATPEGVIEMLAAAAAVNNNNKRKYQQIQQRLSNDEDQENQEQLIRSPPAYNNKENNSVNHHNTNRIIKVREHEHSFHVQRMPRITTANIALICYTISIAMIRRTTNKHYLIPHRHGLGGTEQC